MALAPRGYTRKEAAQAKQRVSSGTAIATAVLDASNTTEDLRFPTGAKVSFQATGDLAGTILFSISGEEYVSSVAIPAANALGSFNTHNVCGIRVTRSGGSGQLFIAVI